MDAEVALNNALRERLYNVSPDFYGRMATATFVLAIDERQRLYDAISLLPAKFHRLLTAVITAFPHLVQPFARYLRVTVQILYYGLRATKYKVMTGPAGSTNRATGGRVQDVFERSPMCAITGLTADDNVTNDACHIVPWSIGKWDDSGELPFFQCIGLLFDEGKAHEAWEISGGRNVNSLDSLMSLSPTFHRIFDRGHLRLVPVYIENQPVGFRVVFRRAPTPGWHVTRANGRTEELVQGYLLNNHPLGCGSPFLHAVMLELEHYANMFRFTSGSDGDKIDLGGLWGDDGA
jgi:hypothetical protein